MEALPAQSMGWAGLHAAVEKAQACCFAQQSQKACLSGLQCELLLET